MASSLLRRCRSSCLRNACYNLATSAHPHPHPHPPPPPPLPPLHKVSGTVSPLLMLPPGFARNMFYKLYSPAHNKVTRLSTSGNSVHEQLLRSARTGDALLVGSSHGWLAWYNNINDTKNKTELFLSNPFSNRRINLPSIDTLPSLDGDDLECPWRRPVKVILSSTSPDDPDCRAVLINGPYNTMAFCCPGLSPKEWTPLGGPCYRNRKNPLLDKMPRSYEDVVYSSRRNRLLCATFRNDLECWDLQDPQAPRLEFDRKIRPWTREEEGEWCRQQKCLVFAEQSDEFFVVWRHLVDHMGPDGVPVGPINLGQRQGWDESRPYKTLGFDVHRIDMENGRDEYMDGSLDGLAFFIGSTSHGLVLDGKHCSPNSIYFADPKELTPPPWDEKERPYGGHDVGIFDYKNRTISPCYYPCDIQSVKKIVPAPLWFAPAPFDVFPPSSHN